MFISRDDFTKACESFRKCWQQADTDCEVWKQVRVVEHFGEKCLRIIKRLPRVVENEVPDNVNDSHESNEDRVVEEDDEILDRSVANSGADTLIIYDIIHSPSYQVPVLHLSVQYETPASQSTSPKAQTIQLSPDSMHDLLVPPSHRGQIQSAGVMGALSMTDHPFSGTPVYFIHPCRTAQAMADGLGEDAEACMKPEQYLMMWMGTIGGSVGLDVPVEMAERLLKMEEAAG